MMTVTTAELQRNFGHYRNAALAAPITITDNGHDRLVMLSVDEYRRLKRQSRAVLSVGMLDDDDLAAIAATEMPPGHTDLDSEIE